MRAGDIVGGRFELISFARAGGMGQVFRALDRSSGAEVALKVLIGNRELDRARFEREARALAELRSPGIVDYIAHGTTPAGDPYLAMEWLAGEDLQRRLARGRLSVGESVAIAAGVAAALAPAHARGFVHRDIKPANIFLVRGDASQVKVLDFGIVFLGGAVPRVTRTNVLVGTPGYMAPEQACAAAMIEPAADVFALGCVLFECLTGMQAFTGEHLLAVLAKILYEDVPRISELSGAVPAALDALVARMLSKDPRARPEGGAAVGQALAALDVAAPGAAEVAAAASRASSPSLTRGEQRVLSVVLLGRKRSFDRDATQDAGAQVTEPAQDAVRDAVAAAGGRFELLVDGSAVITMVGEGAATDQAALSARCALAACALLRDRPAALALGRVAVTGKLVVGDAIDRAARLLARWAQLRPEAASAPAILIDEGTAGLLDVRFEVAEGPAGIELRGEHAPAADVRTLLGKPTACVGRERELSMLSALLDACIEERQVQGILITAPPGIGKSRLAHELLQEVRRRPEPVEVWIGRADAQRRGSAFGALGQALRSACGIRDGEPLAVRREKLRARVAQRVTPADRDRVSDFLGELAGHPHSELIQRTPRAGDQEGHELVPQRQLVGRYPQPLEPRRPHAVATRRERGDFQGLAHPARQARRDHPQCLLDRHRPGQLGLLRRLHQLHLTGLATEQRTVHSDPVQMIAAHFHLKEDLLQGGCLRPGRRQSRKQLANLKPRARWCGAWGVLRGGASRTPTEVP